jgi:transcriptional regulator with XRE-family HTH domain
MKNSDPIMKPGDKLKSLLKSVNKNQEDLARATGITGTSISRYFKWLNAGTLDDKQWATMVKGLRKLGIDPEQVRPIPRPTRLPVDLLPHLDTFDHEQLKALIAILASDDDDAREFVRAVAEDRLRRK